MNQHFLEKNQVIPAIMPANLATGANTGDWVDLAGYGRCAILFTAGVGASGERPTITVSQATSAAGAGSKALNFTRIDVKEATALTGVAQFTTITQAAANTYTDVTGNDQKLWVIDVSAESLDVNNGFAFLQASIADVGTTSQIGVAHYVLHEPRYASKTLPGAIT